MSTPPVLFASSDTGLEELLSNAGIAFERRAVDVDEDAVMQAFLGSGGQELEDLATVLAQARATIAGESEHERLVMAVDQQLHRNGEIYGEVTTDEEAHERLLDLNGKTHTLETAIACVRADKVVWSHREYSRMTMRLMTPQFIGRFVAMARSSILGTKGAYTLNGPGIQLFQNIEGDYFSIRGLPLLPLLHYLRGCGIVQ